MSQARFITFEGIDGAGKSTHIEWMAQTLRAAGQQVVLTREPGGTDFAEQLRTLILNQEMPDISELLILFAARADHIEKRIKPALAARAWVVCDRFVDSSFAYQGAGRASNYARIEQLEQWVVGACLPVRTYVFDLEPAVAAARRAAVRAADRFESEEQAFFERVRGGYLKRIEADPGRMMRIDATQTVARIRQLLAQDLAALLAAANVNG